MDLLTRLCQFDPELLLATPYKIVDLEDGASEAEGTSWWEELTNSGGEGMSLTLERIEALTPPGVARGCAKVAEAVHLAETGARGQRS